jgi:hypothetical protein
LVHANTLSLHESSDTARVEIRPRSISEKAHYRAESRPCLDPDHIMLIHRQKPRLTYSDHSSSSPRLTMTRSASLQSTASSDVK